MDLSVLFHAKEMWDRFCTAHPQFPLFLQALRQCDAMREGTVVEIAITPNGAGPIRSKLRITAEDARAARTVLQFFGR